MCSGLFEKLPVTPTRQPGLWEVRISLADRIARVLFTVHAGHTVLLHGFIKKTPKTPDAELQTAKNRLKQLVDQP